MKASSTKTISAAATATALLFVAASLSSPSTVSAFSPVSDVRTVGAFGRTAVTGAASSYLSMSTEEASASSTTATSVPIVVTGNNVDLTEALTDYITAKIDRTVGKMSSSGAVMDCDVHLTVNKNPKVSYYGGKISVR